MPKGQAGAGPVAIEVTETRPGTTFGIARASVTLTQGEATERVEVPRALGRALGALERVPQTIGEAKEAIYALEMRHARERVVRLVRSRERSRKEVRERLVEEGYAAEVAEAALEEACANRVVSDARFADAFVSSKARAGWGRRRIERELAVRGIDATDVEWPDELDGEAEYERALEIARHHRVSGANPVAKQARYLTGKGYATDVALRAAREAVGEM